MSKSKKKTDSSSNYIKTFRKGAIAANVFRAATADGHTYLTFELSRSWKSQSGKREGYSKKFYPHNADALANVSKQASEWMDANPEAADGMIQDTTAEALIQAA